MKMLFQVSIAIKVKFSTLMACILEQSSQSNDKEGSMVVFAMSMENRKSIRMPRRELPCRKCLYMNMRERSTYLNAKLSGRVKCIQSLRGEGNTLIYVSPIKEFQDE